MTPIVDYAPVIRAELEREIWQLRRQLGEGHQKHVDSRTYSEDYIVPTRAVIGHLIASHHGQLVVQDGEILGGLPVTIDGLSLSRTIRVYADDVPFIQEESDDDDFDDGDNRVEHHFTETLMKESTW